MKSMILRFFPENKSDWKAFIKLSIFSLAATLMLAINGFIDNFMVGHIYKAGMWVNGTQLDEGLAQQMNEASIGGLGSAAQWWFLVSSVGTFFCGSVGFFLAQYFNKGDRRMSQRAATTKMQVGFLWMLPFFILMLVIPQQMISVFTQKGVYDGSLTSTGYKIVSTSDISKYHIIVGDATHQSITDLKNGNSQIYTDILNPSYMDKLGGDYVRIVCIAWLMWTFVLPQNQSMREIGKPQGGALGAFAALVTHVSLNFVFIECTDMGVVGPAIALICARALNFTVSSTFVKINKLPVTMFSNPFIWDWEIYKKWITRWSYLVYGVVWTLAIVFRTFFWSMFFTSEGGGGEHAVDAIVVLGIAGAVQNIFLVAFDALQPLFSRYVSGNMAKDKMKEAKEYADRIIGFGVLLALCVSLFLVGAAFLVPHLTMIWDVNHETLVQVKHCVLVVALVYFSWIILSSVRAIMSSGGRPGTMAMIDGGATWLQSLWILCIGLIHKYTGAFDNFGLAYLTFFVSDIVKLPFFLIPFYKLEWTKNHTIKEATKHAVKA